MLPKIREVRMFEHWARIASGALAAGLLALGTAPASAADPIRLGAPLSLTGSLADEGMKEQQGLDMCVDAVNAKGGVKVGAEQRKLELVKYDYQSETSRAVQIVQRLLTVDKVDFLFAPYGSGDTKATAVLAERYNIPMIATSAATESIYDQKQKNLYGILFPNRAIAEAEIAFYKANVPQAKKIAVFALNSLFPKAIAAEVRNTAAKNGYDVVYDGLYSPGTMDFANVLTQIKAANPDWVYATGYIQELILIRRQMASLGMNVPVVTMTAGAAYPEFAQNLGPLADDVTSNAWWHPSATYKDPYIFGDAEGYVKTFQAKYKKDPTYLEAAATAGCEVLAQAIEQVGKVDVDAVRNVLASKRFETFYGPIKFGANGQNEVASPMLLQIRKGKYVILDPKEIKTGDLVVGVRAQ
jgi:branched-chain amino acid transport system substrate-binding protein